MAQNRNTETEGTFEKKEDRGKETRDQLEELFVSERKKKSSKCESCVSKGLYDRVSIFLCLVCEIYVCAGCMDEHRSHVGMEVWEKESEGKMEGEKMKMCGRKNGGEARDQREKRKNKKPEYWEKTTKKTTKIFEKVAESEERESENGRMKEQSEIERMTEQDERERKLGNFVDQLLNESETERKKKLKKNRHVSICDRVNVKHELDRRRYGISGLCGLENRSWVACDCLNSCIKIFKLGSHVIQRYIRFVESRPCDVTEIHLKQNSAEPSLVSGSSSCISGTDRADLNKPCFIAVTLPWKHQIMFIDVSKKPALRHKVLYTEEKCHSIQFYDEKIFTVCREGLYDFYWSVYIKSTIGDTLNRFDTGIHDVLPVPYLAVVSERVYLTDERNNTVQCRNVKGQVINFITIEGSGPVGISADPDNTVYVCAWQHNTVYKLDADLTRYKSVLDRTADYAGKPRALCYYRDKLFISYDGTPSLENVVTVVRLS